jgi:chromosome segregation ATPase
MRTPESEDVADAAIRAEIANLEAQIAKGRAKYAEEANATQAARNAQINAIYAKETSIKLDILDTNNELEKFNVHLEIKGRDLVIAKKNIEASESLIAEIKKEIEEYKSIIAEKEKAAAAIHEELENIKMVNFQDYFDTAEYKTLLAALNKAKSKRIQNTKNVLKRSAA